MVGCSGPQATEKNRIAICTTVGKLAGDLAAYRPQMTDRQVATVNAVRKVTDPICLADNMPDTLKAYDGLQAAVLDLVELHGEMVR